MKHCPQVEFKVQTTPPDSQGYWWGRAKDKPEAPIMPCMVLYSMKIGVVLLPGMAFPEETYSMDQFFWFGPVHEVKEASCP